MFVSSNSFPFGLKPLGFSRPGKFFRYITLDGHRWRKASVASGKMSEYPIGHKLRKAADSFPCRQAQRSLAVGIARRNFVEKNTRARKVIQTRKQQKKIPMLTHRDLSYNGRKKNCFIIPLKSSRSIVFRWLRLTFHG